MSVVVLSAIGIGLSVLVIMVAQMYGGYANRNWAAADAIAKDYGWPYLDPEKSTIDQELNKSMCACGMFGRAMSLSHAKDPYKELAPVFVVFAWAGRASAVIHTLLILWAFGCMLWGQNNTPLQPTAVGGGQAAGCSCFSQSAILIESIDNPHICRREENEKTYHLHRPGRDADP